MVRIVPVVLSLVLPLAASAAPRDPAAQLDRGLAVRCGFDDPRGDCDPVALRPAPDRAGRPGAAAQFDGVRSYARVRNRIQPARFTVAAWIRPDSVDRVGVVASKIRNLPGSWERNFELRVDPGGRLYLQVPSGTAWDGVQGQRPIVPGRWTHVAAVYDGSRAQLFVDGVRDGAPLSIAYAQSDSDVFVGARPEGGGADGRTQSGPTFFFAGAMDDVRIYDRPLGEDEIGALVSLPIAPQQAGSPAPPPVAQPYPAHLAPPVLASPAGAILPGVLPIPGPANLEARYPLDGDAADASGRGHDGVVHGARPAEDRLGNPTGALAFKQRSRDYVDLGVWTEPEQLTIAAWVRPADARDMIVFSKHSSARRPFDEWLELRLDYSGKVVLELPVSGSRAEIQSTRKLTPGRWTHLAATFDGERAVLYVDGQPDAEAMLAGFDASRGPAFVGARPEASGKKPRLGSTFDGRIDDLVVIRGALAPQQVAALFAPDRRPPRSGGGEADEADDRHDLVRLDQLLGRYDLACARRNPEAVAAAEAGAISEMEGEIREQQRERRWGKERVQQTKRALQEFSALRGRLDGVSLDRKRAILADLAEAAWIELAESLDDDAWTRPASMR